MSVDEERKDCPAQVNALNLRTQQTRISSESNCDLQCLNMAREARFMPVGETSQSPTLVSVPARGNGPALREEGLCFDNGARCQSGEWKARPPHLLSALSLLL